MSGACTNNDSIYFIASSNSLRYLEQTPARYKLSIWSGCSIKLISRSLIASLKRFSLTACVASLISTASIVSLISNLFSVI